MRASDTLSTALHKLQERAHVARIGADAADTFTALSTELDQILTEVTERESALREQNQALRVSQASLIVSHNRYLELFDRAPVCYFTVTSEGVILDANLAAATHLGVAREQLVGQPLVTFVAPASQATLQRHLHRALSTDWRNGSDLTFLRADGSALELYLETTTLPGERTEAESLLLAAVDITGRKEAERALRASEEKYRTLFDDCRDGILALDEHWDIVDANASACRSFGLPLRELARHPLSMLFPAEFGDAQLALLRGEAVATEPRLRELWMHGSEGRLLLVETSLTAGAGAQGRSYQLVLRDVTSRRATDAERHAREREDHTLDALARLSGATAHDFGNVLTAVHGLASAMAGDVAEDAVLREDLDAILAASQRGCDLTRALAGFARKELPRHQTVRLAQVVRDVCFLARRDASEAVPFTLDLDEDLVVEGDAEQLGRALGHVLQNALDVTPDGGCVAISLDRVRSRRDPSREVASLRIVDSGEGLDAETRAHAFEPFFTTKRDRTALGMGLAHAYRLVHNHAGTIDLENAPERGAVVTIELPLPRRANVEERPAPAWKRS